MDDEPPEVQQYKTCAKCRIIERTKKKSRKPLAEETMRYGMRQFQESFDERPLPLPLPAVPPPKPVPRFQPPVYKPDPVTAQLRQQSQFRRYTQLLAERPRAGLPCELCGAKTGDDLVCAMYRLCPACCADPYSRKGVAREYEDFLVRAKASEAVYVCELTTAQVEGLGVGRAVLEQQFRRALMECLRLVYVEPLLALLLPQKLTQTANNATDVNGSPPSVAAQQYFYRRTPPLKAAYALLDATAEFVFVPETNLVVLKALRKQLYPALFVRDLHEQMRGKGLTFDDDALKVYRELLLTVEFEPFVKSFRSLRKKPELDDEDEVDN